MVVREGFEPSKAEPADLQSDPFGHSGTSPIIKFLVVPRRGIEPLFPEWKSDVLTTERTGQWWIQLESNQRPLGYEPSALTNWAMDPIFYGVSEEIRTPDPRLRRALLYPAELQTHKWCVIQDLNLWQHD